MGSDAEALVDVVCDPDRRGLVFIAGSDAGMPLQPWIDLVAELLKDTTGLAAAYVLDSTATETLARALGTSHWSARAPYEPSCRAPILLAILMLSGTGC